jgi:cell division protein FtsW (lipid II flippase)
MLGFFKGRLLFVRLCLLASVLVLVGIGVATIYAVGHPADGRELRDLGGYWRKQLVFAVVGLGGFVVANLVSYRRLGIFSYWIYGIVLLLLMLLFVGRYVVALPFVPESHYAHRWIVLDPRLPWVQPSEFCKVAFILALAWYLRYRSNYRRFRALIGPFALTVLPMAMILVEPDLGTVLLMMPVLFAMLFVAGAKLKHLGIVVLMAIALSPVMWFKMESYQRLRISCVLLQSPLLRKVAEQNTTVGRILVGSNFSERRWRNDWGYHIIRSKCAVASGGLTGFGFRQGPFIKYNFLDERHNDFIFSVVAHQWGLLGCIGLLLMYVVVFACGFKIAANNTDPFGRLIAIGITVMFIVQVMVNVGMTLGLMPITGLTLPFVSYGGSSLLVSLTAAGLLNNVGRSRPFTVARKR